MNATGACLQRFVTLTTTAIKSRMPSSHRRVSLVASVYTRLVNVAALHPVANLALKSDLESAAAALL